MMLCRVNVVTIVFSDRANYTLRLTECRRNGLSTEVEKAMWPAVVSVGGYGVITKQAGAETERVMVEGSGFVWTRQGDNISFVRAEQLNALGEVLEGVRIVGIRCAKESEREVAEWYFGEMANLRTILRPSAEGSAMARAVASRLKFPVLGAVVLALAVNMAVAPRVRERSEAAAVELQALRKSVGQADETSRHRREMIAEYDTQLPRRVSVLCDRAASVVPVGVMLTSLAVQPLSKPLGNNRKTEFTAGRIEIGGRAKIPQQVSRYVESLATVGIARQVRLASMERDEEVFEFRIALDI